MRPTYQDRVARFYNKVQVGYDFAVSRDYLRYGQWDDSTRTPAQSLVNTDRFVAEILDLGPEDTLLDAGCGVGGSARYFAQTCGARVVGINISRGQLNRARRKARRAGLDARVSFEQQDYLATGFADGHFSKLCAIESMYHAECTARFTREAYRLLAPGGRIAVVDRFLLRDGMNAAETRLYDRFRRGQVVAGLPSLGGFRQTLYTAGFEKIEFIDRLGAIQPSIDRTHQMCRFSFPISFTLSALRVLPSQLHSQTVGLMAIKQLFGLGVVTYGGFVARKP